MVLFKSPRDQTIIHTLARQMFPGCGQYLVEAYQNATEKPYSYLLMIKSVVQISATQKRKLARYKHQLRLLTHKATPLDKRRRVLIQKGDGFLTLVLGSVLKELGSLIA